ncbi:PAS domain S-box protein [Synechococcales cyanobacterium C]|uniref:PAS domain S-box protein n=1 Tax=Petrachloros mirabilis ULC683 TaxID=2781853 RepID=A0A8K1ZY31_9CYAN|nr:PAS domain S-box protein [Petrachloros mirabilis]NCJ05957.1 PAS domain S-box protein [Petrachloros mirabilis ULC683]
MTVRRQMETDLQVTLSTLLAVTPLPTAVIACQGHKILLQNPGVARFLGCPEEAPPQVLDSEWFSDPHQALTFFAQLQTNQRAENQRIQFCQLNGNAVEALVSAQKFIYQAVPAVLMVWTDIPQQRQTPQLQALLETAVHHSGDAIEITDADVNIQYVNPAFEAITGYSASEAVGQTPASLLRNHEQDENFHLQLWKTLSSGQVWQGHLTSRHKDGTPLHQEVTFAPILNEAGVISNFVAVRRDITQSQQIASDGFKFVALVENSNDFIAMSKPTGEILYVNPAGCQMVGLENQSEALRKTIIDYLPETEVAAFCQNVLPKLQQEGRSEGEGKLRNFQTGLCIDVHRSCFIVRHPETHEILCLATIQRDITAQKQAERALRDSEARYRVRANQQAAVATLGQKALAGIDLPTLMQAATQQVSEVLGVKLCGIFELMPNGYALQLTAGVGWRHGLVGVACVGSQPQSQIGYALATQQPVIIEDFRVDKRFGGPPLLHNHCIVSGISVVIPGQANSYGVLGAYCQHQQQFNQDDIHFLQAMANVLAAAINRHQSEAQLRLMERVIAASSHGILITDANQPDNPITYVNPAFEAMTGYTQQEIVGHNCRFLQGQDTQQPALDVVRQALQRQEDCRVVLRNYRKDGSLFWNELHIAPVFDAEGYLTHFVGIQNDISQRKQAEEALRKSEEQFRVLFEQAPIGMALSTPDGHFLEVNPALCSAFGYSAAELMQRTFADLADPDAPNPDGMLMTQLLTNELSHFQVEKRYLSKTGQGVDTLLQVTLVRDERGLPLHVLSQVVDISDRKRLEEQLTHDAFHDSLTGLPNRLMFLDRLQQAIARVQQHPQRQFAILFLDIDRFKVINDSLGHVTGDQLLVEVAGRLQACLRPQDLVARLGGDEFTILLERVQDLKDATTVADRIQQALRAPFYLDHHEIFTTASIGIALNTDVMAQPAELLRNADTALYQAKENGRACYAFFSTEMHNKAVEQLLIETNLRWAVERNELQVHYQPIYSLQSGKIKGFEALVRWQHPQWGLISPAEFIPVAEETGLIAPIGEWVLWESCRQLRQWQQAHPELTLSMNVNLSSKQLAQPHLARYVERVLLQTGLGAESLKLEITESGIMANTELAAVRLQELKALGVALCVDDFGTGYSSLSRLHQFPLDTIKIDRSFVCTLDDKPENHAIVRAILTLAHSLDMTVVAEGIETAAQLTQLKALGCEYGQGYFFAKPLKAKAIQLLLT